MKCITASRQAGELHARRHHPSRGAGQDLRRQDHPHPHPHHPAGTGRGYRPRRRRRRPRRPGRRARPDRPGGPVRHRRRLPHRPREHRDDRPALRPVAAPGAAERRRRARAHPSHGRGRPAGQDLLRRDAPSPGPGRVGRLQDPDRGAAPPGGRRHHAGGRGAAQTDPRRGLSCADRPPRHPRRRQRPCPTRGGSSMSTITTTRPLGLGRTASDIAVIARRDLVRSLRLPDVLVTSSVMPVIFILMFTYVFGGAIQGALPPAAAGRYVNWLIPGLLAQFALFGSQGAAFRMAEDLAKGVIDRFRSLPMARSAVPTGRTLADLVGTTRTMVLLLAVGLAIGFRWQTSPWRLLAGVAIALGFGYAWSWAMAALGLVVRTPEAVQAASFMGAFPLAFTSSVFVPTQTLPGWLQAFAAHQPVTVTTNALRGLMLGQGALPPGQTVSGQVALALAWSAAITAVFAPLAVRLYRRTVS